MSAFEERADRVWVSRRPQLDLNVTVIAGSEGVLVVDTGCCEPCARDLVADVRALGAGPVRVVVNTHAHYDHTYGNGVMAAAFPGVEIVAHENAVSELAATPARLRSGAEGDLGPCSDDILAVDPLLPTTTFSSVHVVDLGGRTVELVHPGPAHTSGDLVAVLREAATDVLVVGDLMEATPCWGDDSFPLAWPAALDLVAGLVSADTVVVPGHGPLMSAPDVADQHQVVAAVAQQIADLAVSGVPLDQATDRGVWPVPSDRLGHAVARGWHQLPRGSKRLPMA